MLKKIKLKINACKEIVKNNLEASKSYFVIGLIGIFFLLVMLPMQYFIIKMLFLLWILACLILGLLIKSVDKP